MKNTFTEQYKRSIAKAIGFRAAVIITDIVIIYLLTRRIDLTLGIIVFSNISATIIYYFYERAWNRSDWGKIHIEKK